MITVKRWWSALLLALVVLAGCGGATPTQSPATQPPTDAVAQSTAAVPPTELPTAELPVPPTATQGESAATPAAEVTATPSTPQDIPADIAVALVENDGSVVLVEGSQRAKLGSFDPALVWNLPTCNTVTDLAWSPDGHRLAFAGGILTLGDETALAPLGGYHVRWSPDGQKFAYIASWGEDADELTIAEEDGINPERAATGHWSTTGYPNWSPDGTQAVAGQMLRLDNADSADVKAPEEFGNNGAWSPDGKLFTWIEPEGDENVLRLRVKQWDGAQEFEVAVLQFERDPAYPTEKVWWTSPGWTLPPLTWLPRGNLLLAIPREGLRNMAATYLIQPDGRYGPFGDDQLELCDISADGKMMLGRRTADGHIVAFDAVTRTTLADLGPGMTARWRPTPQGPAPAAPFAEASPTLSLTDPRTQGPAVLELQSTLTKLGYLESVDEIFGPETEAAVRSFQKQNLLDEDGIVGRETWIMLRSFNPCPAGANPLESQCQH